MPLPPQRRAYVAGAAAAPSAIRCRTRRRPGHPRGPPGRRLGGGTLVTDRPEPPDTLSSSQRSLAWTNPSPRGAEPSTLVGRRHRSRRPDAASTRCRRRRSNRPRRSPSTAILADGRPASDHPEGDRCGRGTRPCEHGLAFRRTAVASGGPERQRRTRAGSAAVTGTAVRVRRSDASASMVGAAFLRSRSGSRGFPRSSSVPRAPTTSEGRPEGFPSAPRLPAPVSRRSVRVFRSSSRPTARTLAHRRARVQRSTASHRMSTGHPQDFPSVWDAVRTWARAPRAVDAGCGRDRWPQAGRGWSRGRTSEATAPAHGGGPPALRSHVGGDLACTRRRPAGAEARRAAAVAYQAVEGGAGGGGISRQLGWRRTRGSRARSGPTAAATR
jgi:hypothetical protein